MPGLIFPRYINIGGVILTNLPPLSGVKLELVRATQENVSINGKGYYLGSLNRQWRTLTISSSDNCFMPHTEKVLLHELEPFTPIVVQENYSDPTALRVWNCVIREPPTFAPANILDSIDGIEYYDYSFSFLIPEV